MDIASGMRALRESALAHREFLKNEEAAKNALVMPMMRALGYDVFNPMEFKPEYTLDVGTKKGERVDYATCRGDKIEMLIECKDCRVELDPKRFRQQFTQLYRYFSVTSARIAVLTNGIQYRFFTDLVKPNVMDDEAFYVFDLLNMKKDDIRIMSLFGKAEFDLDRIIPKAQAMRTRSILKGLIVEQMRKPSDDLVRIIAGETHGSRLTQGIRDSYRATIANLFEEIVAEETIKGIAAHKDTKSQAPLADCQGPVPETPPSQDEMEVFGIIRAVCARHVDPARISMRSAKSHRTIVLDDSGRKAIAKIQIPASQPWHLTAIFNREETRIPIEDALDIYSLEGEILSRLHELDPEMMTRPRKTSTK